MAISSLSAAEDMRKRPRCCLACRKRAERADKGWKRPKKANLQQEGKHPLQQPTWDLRMRWKRPPPSPIASGLVCHTSRGSKSLKVPFFAEGQGIFTPCNPSFYYIVWGHIFANMGGGGCRVCFHMISRSKITGERRFSVRWNQELLISEWGCNKWGLKRLWHKVSVTFVQNLRSSVLVHSASINLCILHSLMCLRSLLLPLFPCLPLWIIEMLDVIIAKGGVLHHLSDP